MIFSDEEIKKIVEIEVELLKTCSKINEKVGEVAIKSAINDFYNFLVKVKGKFYAPLDFDYRKFLIELIKTIPDEILDKTIMIMLER